MRILPDLRGAERVLPIQPDVEFGPFRSGLVRTIGERNHEESPTDLVAALHAWLLHGMERGVE